MHAYFDAFFGGIEIVLNPHILLSLTWQQAAIAIRVCLAFVGVGAIWMAVRREAPPAAYAVIAGLFALLVWGGFRAQAGQDPLAKFYAHREFEIFSFLHMGVLGFAGLSVGSGIRVRPFTVLFLILGVVAGTALPLLDVPPVSMRVLMFFLIGFNSFLTGCVLTDILDTCKSDMTDELIGPFRVAFAGLIAVCIVASLVPQEAINQTVLNAPPGLPTFADASTGEIIPEKPLALLAAMREKGIVAWLFPGGLVLGLLLNVPGRFIHKAGEF